MSQAILRRESKQILRQMSNVENSSALLCPILKVLQMRHSNLDISLATKIVRGILHD